LKGEKTMKKYIGCEPSDGDGCTDFFLLENGKVEIQEVSEGIIQETLIMTKKEATREYGLLISS